MTTSDENGSPSAGTLASLSVFPSDEDTAILTDVPNVGKPSDFDALFARIEIAANEVADRTGIDATVVADALERIALDQIVDSARRRQVECGHG